LERLNSDPEYLREKIHEAFPELSAGDVIKLWQVRENRTELIALPVDVNNAEALFSFDELNRSCVYIKADVSTWDRQIVLYIVLFYLTMLWRLVGFLQHSATQSAVLLRQFVCPSVSLLDHLSVTFRYCGHMRRNTLKTIS